MRFILHIPISWADSWTVQWMLNENREIFELSETIGSALLPKIDKNMQHAEMCWKMQKNCKDRRDSFTHV